MFTMINRNLFYYNKTLAAFQGFL